MRIAPLVVAVFVLLVGASIAKGSQAELPGIDKCGIRIEGPRLTGGGKKAYLWAEFSVVCKRNMTEVGAFACLQEVDYPGDPGRPVECHALEQRPYFQGNELVLTMVASCEYTTIPRYYYVSGYGWATFLPRDGGLSDQSPEIRSYNPLHPNTLWRKVMRAKGSVRYCHISAKNMRWREAK